MSPDDTQVAVTAIAAFGVTQLYALPHGRAQRRKPTLVSSSPDDSDDETSPLGRATW